MSGYKSRLKGWKENLWNEIVQRDQKLAKFFQRLKRNFGTVHIVKFRWK